MRRAGFQLQQKIRFSYRISILCANSSGHGYLTPTYQVRYCLQFRELGGFVRREINAWGRMRQALIHIHTTNNALGRCA